MRQGSKVSFIFVEGSELPSVVVDSAIYFVNGAKELYVGNNLIANINVFCNTTANWNQQTSLISKRGAIYIYSDRKTLNGNNLPGFKIGDGLAYVIDLPFADADLQEHINNTLIHVSSEDRAKWNNKIRCYLDVNNQENLVFTIN